MIQLKVKKSGESSENFSAFNDDFGQLWYLFRENEGTNMDISTNTGKPHLNDENSSNRKQDHLDLALKSQLFSDELMSQFNYEPMLMGHPSSESREQLFLGQKIQTPFWVSSMTGGTEHAYAINHLLADACARHGMGMGLGSIRPLLEDRSRFKDFDLRGILGSDLPFYANLGVAQIEQILDQKWQNKIIDLLGDLKVCGLIVHVNPLQEFLQPEGDRFLRPPLETIQELAEAFPFKLMVKEVGQGFGPKSLEALLSLPIDGIELAGFGGTNFSKLEIFRQQEISPVFQDFQYVGHTAIEMIDHLNKIWDQHTGQCQNIIISGGVNSILQAYYLRCLCPGNSVIGMASNFLRHALLGKEKLNEFIIESKKAYSLAQNMLTLKQ